MQYTTLGKTGLIVSRLTLGTMTSGTGTSRSGFHHPVDQAQATAMISASIDAGINFFDTANNYSDGQAEVFLGRALAQRRKDVIIATKLGSRTSTILTDAGLSYRHVIASAEASLQRLGTDYIDLLQIHVPDRITPFEETARALDQLVQRGLVRYVGYSNLAGWQAATFLGIQHRNHYAHFISAQMYYSLVGRDIEYGVVPFLQHAGLGLLVWSPLAGGFLSGKYTRENTTRTQGRLASFDYLSMLAIDLTDGYRVIDALCDIAASYQDATPAQVALAWLLTKSVVSSIIIGASTPAQLSDNVAAARVILRQEDVEKLDMLVTPRPLYPYLWMASEGDLMMRQALENHVSPVL